MYVCKPKFNTWPNCRTFNLQLQGCFNSAWQLAQTSGVKGSMNLTSKHYCKLVPTHLESAAKFWITAKKGTGGFGQSTLPVPWLTPPVFLYCALFPCGNEISQA